MKILIVEDDKYKSEAILDCLQIYFPVANINITESLASGLFALIDEDSYQLIILDMSMPSFDITEKDPTGGTPESYAGEDFLAQMTLLGITTPVIVVTQYNNFGIDEQQISLSTLSKKLLNDHPAIYQGSIYFKVSSTTWKTELKNLLKKQDIK
ncbi:hypothetical protein MJH12_02260 [bacterium]|nr:hypothetical protein [bacterium]